MKNSYLKIVIALTILLSTTTIAQIKNAKTETVKIYGNCGMCKTKIEKAGNLKKVAQVDWNIDTKMATLTYDAKKTNQDEILKRIALAGYDNDTFLAPNSVYDNLHGCCQYDRSPLASKGESPISSKDGKSMTTQNSDPLEAVFENYFAVKDALVKTDGTLASTKATALLASINVVKMDKLEMDVHMVWMKVLGNLKSDAEKISKSNDVAKQRNLLNSLTNSIYALLKVAKTETPTYYQFCPMVNDGKGANWLSKENTIKNPYYGAQMLTCGKTVETIK